MNDWPEKFKHLYPRWICSNCHEAFHMPWVQCRCGENEPTKGIQIVPAVSIRPFGEQCSYPGQR